MSTETNRPSERAMKCAEEVILFLNQQCGPSVGLRIVGRQYSIAELIDRHFTGGASEWASNAAKENEPVRGGFREERYQARVLEAVGIAGSKCDPSAVTPMLPADTLEISTGFAVSEIKTVIVNAKRFTAEVP
jgi:hypothetical protein